MVINRLKDYNRIVKSINKRYEIWRMLKNDKNSSKEERNTARVVSKEYKYLLDDI
jgi:hypothetical protein